MTEINAIQNQYYIPDITAASDSVKINDEKDIIITNETEEPIGDEFKPNIIAHRGYSEVAPENTIPAFIAAAENGFQTVECDIEWTKDNVPVILHDEKINRTARKANGAKLILPRKCSKYTYEQLQKFDFGIWKGEEFKGTKIPSFAQVLDCVDDYDLNLYVEIKKTKNFDAEKAKILVDLVKEAGLEDKVTWISFYKNNLKEIKDLLPEARLGYLLKKAPTENTIKTLEELQTDSNEVFLDIKSTEITPENIDMIKDAGFEIETWTINDDKDLENVYSYNLQGFTTDTINDETMETYITSQDQY